MTTQEIFDRLMALTNRLEAHYPLTDQDKSLLWDVGKVLDLSTEQCALLARDKQPPTGAAPAAIAAVETPELSATDSPFDFGLGVGSLSSEAVADDEAYTRAKMQIAAMSRPARPAVKQKLCDCGHYTSHPMNASLGTSCPDCYDRMSD